MQPIESIVSLGRLVEIGYRLEWAESSCILWHPTRGVMRAQMINGCPEITPKLARSLIGDIEPCNLEAARKKARLARIGHATVSWPIEVMWKALDDLEPDHPNHGPLMYLCIQCLFSEASHKTLSYLSDVTWNAHELPWNRRHRRSHQRASGLYVRFGSKGVSKQCHSVVQDHGLAVLQLDARRSILDKEVWGCLIEVAVRGKILKILRAWGEVEHTDACWEQALMRVLLVWLIAKRHAVSEPFILIAEPGVSHHRHTFSKLPTWQSFQKQTAIVPHTWITESVLHGAVASNAAAPDVVKQVSSPVEVMGHGPLLNNRGPSAQLVIAALCACSSTNVGELSGCKRQLMSRSVATFSMITFLPRAQT